MRLKIFLYFIMLFCFGLGSCDYIPFFKTNGVQEGGKIVAKVYDKVLYESEILDLSFQNQAKEDSTAKVRQYINSWLKKNALIYHAEDQLEPEELARIERQVADYRKSLIMFAFEKALTSEKVDTNIANADLISYFKLNKENFKSNDNLIKIRYLVLANTNPELDSLVKAFENLDINSGNVEVLQDAAFKYNATHSFTGQWFKYNDFKEKLKIPTKRSPEKFLMNNTKLTYADSLNTYLVKIDTFSLAGNYMLFEYCKNDVKSIMMNKRQKHFMSNTKENMYNDAVNKNKVEIFD